MIVVGLMGMVCAVIGSLMAKKGVAIEADKIVHFIGYNLLGALMVLGLRPMLWPLGMLLVAGSAPEPRSYPPPKAFPRAKGSGANQGPSDRKSVV